MRLAADLETDDEEEQRHHDFVHEEVQRHVDVDEHADVDEVDFPEVLVGRVPGRILPCERERGCAEQHDAAHGFDVLKNASSALRAARL